MLVHSFFKRTHLIYSQFIVKLKTDYFAIFYFAFYKILQGFDSNCKANHRYQILKILTIAKFLFTCFTIIVKYYTTVMLNLFDKANQNFCHPELV